MAKTSTAIKITHLICLSLTLKCSKEFFLHKFAIAFVDHIQEITPNKVFTLIP
jgi:hypothetical protein